jgi:hypothetical protein
VKILSESESDRLLEACEKLKEYQAGFRGHCIAGSEDRVRMAFREMDACDLAEIIYQLYSVKNAEHKVSFLTEIVEDVLDRAATKLWLGENPDL